MHIGWNWIKQRPHYIAEGLSTYYDVTVVSDHSYRVKSVKNKDSETNTLHIKEFYKIPMFDHSHMLGQINNLLRRIFYRYQLNIVKPDYLYIMKPNAIRFLPEELGRVKLIYDCMDNMVAFAENEGLKNEVIITEERLIKRADLVIVSSENLLNVLKSRYPISGSKNICVIRNGYNGEIYEKNTKNKEKKGRFTICYFGTVASWFNFQYFIDAFKEIPSLKLLIIGPLQSGTTIPKHPNIQYIGSVQHEELEQYVEDADAFTMPFIVNELIESVDPVKLYEYINFYKDILCVRYGEIKRFEPFVYFYDNYDSFIMQIKKLISSHTVKYTQEERIAFLKENSWKKRVNLIREQIEALRIDDEK